MKTTLLSLCIAVLLTSCGGAYTHYINRPGQEPTAELRSASDTTFRLKVHYTVASGIKTKKKIAVTTQNKPIGPVVLKVNGHERKEMQIQDLHPVYFLSKIDIKKGDSVSLNWNNEVFDFVVLDSVAPQPWPKIK